VKFTPLVTVAGLFDAPVAWSRQHRMLGSRTDARCCVQLLMVRAAICSVARQLIQSTRDVPFAGKVGRGDLCKIVAPGLAPAYGRRLSEKMRK
jgi:hypothetical protein